MRIPEWGGRIVRNVKHFAELYRNKISEYAQWREPELGLGLYFNALISAHI